MKFQCWLALFILSSGFQGLQTLRCDYCALRQMPEA